MYNAFSRQGRNDRQELRGQVAHLALTEMSAVDQKVSGIGSLSTRYTALDLRRADVADIVVAKPSVLVICPRHGQQDRASFTSGVMRMQMLVPKTATGNIHTVAESYSSLLANRSKLRDAL